MTPFSTTFCNDGNTPIILEGLYHLPGSTSRLFNDTLRPGEKASITFLPSESGYPMHILLTEPTDNSTQYREVRAVITHEQKDPTSRCFSITSGLIKEVFGALESSS